MKKKTLQQLEMGYCPFESRYTVLYRDTKAGRLALLGEKAVSRYKFCIVTRECSWPGEGHDTVDCIVTGEARQAGECVTIHLLYCDRDEC